MSSGDFSIGGKVWPGTSKVLEEMGELSQVLGKLIGSHGEVEHYDGSNLRDKLVEEIGDLRAALSFFQEFNMTPEENNAVAERIGKKIVLFMKWQAEGK
jgi:hypothetical protein